VIPNAPAVAAGDLLAGFAAAVGLTQVVVPELDSVLVNDSTRTFLVLSGSESEVAVSTDYRFNFDATSIRIKVRAAIGIPAPAKAIRKLTLGGGNSEPAKATPAKASR
jgi:hypothetical protein